MQLDWITIFDDVVQMIFFDRAFNGEQLTLAITSGSWMEPVLYRLLVIRPMRQGNRRVNVIEEVCRLGTLLFLSPLWRALGQSPVWTSAISRKLLLVLTQNTVDWNELRPLLIWVLYFATIETEDLGDQSQFLFMLATLASRMQLLDWQEIMQVVKGVLWSKEVFSSHENAVQDEVMQIVTQNTLLHIVLAETL